MFDFEPTEEQKAISKMAEDFGEREIAPRARKIIEEEKIPDEIIKEMAELGLLAPNVSEKYGGAGLDLISTALIGKEIAKFDPTGSTLVYYLLQASWAYAVMRTATEEAKKEILPQVCKGKFLGIITTEEGAGTDLGSTEARIECIGNGKYVINGRKTYISGLREAEKYGGWFVGLFKQTPELGVRGMTLVCVKVADPGVLVKGVATRFMKGIGRRGISFGEVSFENVEIDEKYIMGKENKGFYDVHIGFNLARMIIAMGCVGAGRQAQEDVIEYMKQRFSFGAPLATSESIQNKIAEDATKLDALELLTLKALWTFEKEEKKEAIASDVAKAAAEAKMFAPVWAGDATFDAVLGYGAFGYTYESYAAQAYLAIISFFNAEGSHWAMMRIVAKAILGKEFFWKKVPPTK